ncbi:MAG: hypothetical protein GX446_10610 [Chthonomonadales bacterium]|nr:hypothetical protein [Chthonomonadales bacterium]
MAQSKTARSRTGAAAGRDHAGTPGYTVVELLVVVAVIIVLAALLLPVMARSREKARQVDCASRLAQLAKASLAYAEDYDGHLPPYWNRWVHPEPVPDSVGQPRPDLLHAALQPFLRDRAVWFCPSDPLAGRDEEVWRVNHRYSSYAFNFKRWPLLTTEGDQTYLSSPSPARRDTLSPAGYKLILDPNGDPANGCPSEGGNHFGGVNVAYLDGHVKWANRCR